jgi:hypothetical protein
MKIELKEITVREVVNGYVNSDEEGVVGYGGLLNIRPKYQREFVYKDKQRDAVIETIWKNFPLNVMYWVANGNHSFEVLDGQQRTVSICEYVQGNFSIDLDGNPLYFHNLQSSMPNKAEEILDYKLMIYFCEGTDAEKLEWFKTINIAGEKLTDQELRNAIYTGSWLTDAKRHFSKTGCPAYHIGKDYLSGSPIRQDYLETAISWISGGKIEQYMAENQHKANANELWLYFQNVIHWVKVIFPNYRREMKGLDWGNLYNQFKDKAFDTAKLETEIKRLMQDDDVSKKSGIYEYLLTGKEKYLNIRAFTDTMKRGAYERQNGICALCNEHFELSEMEADHITPWHSGGLTNAENCQMLCKECNRRKSGK